MHRKPRSLALFLLLAISVKAYAVPPNVVVVLTDDQGWGDLEINGNTNLKTPNIDSLAHDGTTVEHFYVCQVCAPTRAEFFTGRYYPRTGVSGVSRGEERLNADETTIAEVFRASGYRTGAFGKWHNGTQSPLHPNDKGFDEFYGFTSGHWGHYFSPPLDHNGTMVRGNGFVVDDFTDHAIDFIREHRSKPFFCYLPLNTPHSPMMIDDRFYNKFKDQPIGMTHRDPKREDVMMTRAALAMVENIDWNVGRLLASIDELGLRENTIVVFFSDNGPNSYRWNGGMKGRKGAIDEGGLRSPLMIRWPGKIKHARRLRPIQGAIDLLPTLCDLCGVDLESRKPLDGVSFAPNLLGRQTTKSDRLLFAVKGKNVSVRSQNFRLDATGKLFHIESDPGQTKDVSKQYPERFAELSKAARSHLLAMQKEFEANSDRPFHVGFGKHGTLPARDAIPHGSIERSSKAPNNSFLVNWTSSDDAITWDVDVAKPGLYDVTLRYTCREGNENAVVQLASDAGGTVKAKIKEVFDPPLYDKSKERVEKSHYFVKDFRPIDLGSIKLSGGRQTLTLRAIEIPGKGVVDVHSIDVAFTKP